MEVFFASPSVSIPISISLFLSLLPAGGWESHHGESLEDGGKRGGVGIWVGVGVWVIEWAGEWFVKAADIRVRVELEGGTMIWW